MTSPLLIGSGNRDKAAELRQLLVGLPWEVVSLTDFPPAEEPEENQDTFEDNALLKARYYGSKFCVACVADDSGLEVDALGGAPGIYSARYAGPGCSYDDNNRKLLGALAAASDDRRTARFVCCAAFIGLDGTEHVERGTIEGRIAASPHGVNGFGYDPLFIPEGMSLTFGELDPAAKHSVSHRGRAFRQLRRYLESLVAHRYIS